MVCSSVTSGLSFFPGFTVRQFALMLVEGFFGTKEGGTFSEANWTIGLSEIAPCVYNWKPRQIRKLRYRQLSAQTASKRQSQASETKLLAWPQSCCQPGGTQEQAYQRTCHGSSRPFTSPAIWPNGSAHSRLSKVLSLSLQTLVEEEPLPSLFSPVLQEVFTTITDFR